MFKERNKFTLLSLLALVVVSTAFTGISIYAQTDDSELTTFEEEAIAAGADMGDSGLEEDTDNATSDDVANETGTASAEDETSTASTDCITLTSSEEEISTSSNATGAANATSTMNSTSTASNATSTGNATSTANVTSTEPLDMSNATSTADCVMVTLTPTEQSVGGTVLVNATGLAESTNTTVTAGDLIAGFPESDENGNLLYALGTSDEMSGSVTVTVEDGEGNIGSATLTIIGSQEEQTEPEDATSTSNATEPTSNLTAPDVDGTTTAQDETGTAGQMNSNNGASAGSSQKSTGSDYKEQ